MDMKALHRIPEERIAAVLRVPAIIAGLGAGLDRSTYANFREAREMFAEMTLMPLYAFDQATLNMQLTPEFTSDKRIKVAFDITDLRALQEDEDAKYARLDQAVRTGWIRKNEARSDVGLPPDMDDTVPVPAANPLGQPGQDQQRQPTPTDAGKKALSPMLPNVLQALVDMGVPGLQDDLEEYFDGQRVRVKSALVSNG